MMTIHNFSLAEISGYIYNRLFKQKWIIAVVPLLLITMPISLMAQSQDSTSLSGLYNAIKAQQVNFPLPKKVETITVGTVDLSYGKPGDIPRKVPSFDFSVERYTDGSSYKVYRQIAPTPDFPEFTSMTQDVPNMGGTVTAANILQLNMRIAIINWDQFPIGSTVVFKLGSQTQTVQKGATEVIFQNVTDTSPAFSITINGYQIVKSIFEPFIIKGLLPFYIKWQTVGAGVITIPVLPASIIYAPIADQQQTNVAGNTTSNPPGTSTSISFSIQNGTTNAVPSSFQNLNDIRKRMGFIGSGLIKSPDSTIIGIGTALNSISSRLAPYAATQNTSIAVNQQNMLTIRNASSATQAASSDPGGPGSGDLISYYYNARVLWYSENGVMGLVLLGVDGFSQATVSQLKAVLLTLKNQSPGAKDAQWHLNSASINSLLTLDPFTNGGPRSIPDPSRFIDISQATIQTSGQTFQRTFNYTVSTFNANSTAKTVTDIENDNPGFASFLGLGLTADQTIQSQIGQSASLQNSSGQALSQPFTFNGDGNEVYSCRVYYDVIFGTFAFRDVSPQNPIEVSGTYYDNSHEAVPDAIITLKSGNSVFSTNTDNKGHFKFSLTNSNIGTLDLSANNAEVKVEFAGKPVKRVKLLSL
jgi:hypothetical protein